MVSIYVRADGMKQWETLEEMIELDLKHDKTRRSPGNLSEFAYSKKVLQNSSPDLPIYLLNHNIFFEFVKSEKNWIKIISQHPMYPNQIVQMEGMLQGDTLPSKIDKFNLLDRLLHFLGVMGMLPGNNSDWVILNGSLVSKESKVEKEDLIVKGDGFYWNDRKFPACELANGAISPHHLFRNLIVLLGRKNRHREIPFTQFHDYWFHLLLRGFIILEEKQYRCEKCPADENDYRYVSLYFRKSLEAGGVNEIENMVVLCHKHHGARYESKKNPI